MRKAVFISYSTEDRDLATKVCELLEQYELACWIAPRDVPAGAEFDQAILDAIETTQAMVLILSRHANASPFVKNEVNRAFANGKTIFTLRVEDVLPARSLEFYLARHQWTDGFPPPVEKKVLRFAAAIQALLGTPSRQEANRTHGQPAPPSNEAIVLFNLGLAYYQKAEYDSAIREFTGAIEVHPDFASAYTLRGVCHLQRNEHDKAIMNLTVAIRLNPRDAVAYTKRGVAYARRNEFEKGIADCTAAIQLQPTYADAYLNRGTMYHYKCEDDKALADFNEAIRLDPQQAQGYVNRAGIYRLKGEGDNARADYERAVQLGVPRGELARVDPRIDEALKSVHALAPITRLPDLPPQDKAKALMTLASIGWPKIRADLEYLSANLPKDDPHHAAVTALLDIVRKVLER